MQLEPSIINELWLIVKDLNIKLWIDWYVCMCVCVFMYREMGLGREAYEFMDGLCLAVKSPEPAA